MFKARTLILEAAPLDNHHERIAKYGVFAMFVV